jgi:hypothetical protein
VTEHADLVYVVNAGGNGNVVGFRWQYGQPTEIPNSTRFLSASNSAPGSIAFSPDGKFLPVSEKQTSKLDVFSVQGDGTLSPVVVTPSAGPGEFSISFAPNFYRIVEVYFPSKSALEACAATDGRTGDLGARCQDLNRWNSIDPDRRGGDVQFQPDCWRLGPLPTRGRCDCRRSSGEDGNRSRKRRQKGFGSLSYGRWIADLKRGFKPEVPNSANQRNHYLGACNFHSLCVSDGRPRPHKRSTNYSDSRGRRNEETTYHWDRAMFHGTGSAQLCHTTAGSDPARPNEKR